MTFREIAAPIGTRFAHWIRRPWAAPALLVSAILAAGWMWRGPVYALGSKVGFGVCHQLAAHSFAFSGERFPLCARCTGAFGGFLATAMVLAAMGRGRRTGLPRTGGWLALAAIVGIMAVDGTNSLVDLASRGALHLYTPSNWLRFATGQMYAVALALVIVPVFHNALWAQDDLRPMIESTRAYLSIPALAGAGTAVVAALGDSLAGPLALLSTLGVIAALAMVNTTAVLAATGRGGRATRWRDALLPIAAGVALSVAELAVLSAVRTALGPLGVAG